LKEIEGASGIAFKEGFRLGYAPVDMSLGSEVDHEVSILEHVPYKRIVCQVSLDGTVSGVSLKLLDVCRIAPHQMSIYICDYEISA
jgi:hypothetical protein